MPNDDNSPFDENEEQVEPQAQEKAADETAAERWEDINQGVGEDQREDLKQDLPDSAPRKRRRRRRRPVENNGEIPASPFDMDQESDEAEKAQKAKNEENETEEEAKNDYEPVAPVVEDLPVNPFEGEKVIHDDFSPEEFGASDEKIDENDAVESSEVSFSDEGEKNSEEEVLEPEVIDVESVPVVEVTSESNYDTVDFKEGFWDILKQAGIGKGHFIAILVFFGIVIIAFIIFLFNFGEADNEPTTVKKTEETKVVESVEEPSAPSNNSEADGLITSYIIGLEFTNPLTPIVANPLDSLANLKGIDAGLLSGGALDSKTQFGAYMSLLRQLQEVYSTDVYAYLDLSTNRRKSLADYLSRMNQLIVQGNAAYNQINVSMNAIEAEFNALEDERAIRETQFFELSQALYGDTAYAQLDSFVTLSQRASKLKADFNAYKLLADMYFNSLDALEPRYEDVVLNQEALIKGIKVFDLPYSDIDAIIRLNP